MSDPLPEAPPRIQPLADGGLLATFGDAIGVELSRRIGKVVNRLDDQALAGVVDLVPSYTTLTIVIDPLVADAGAIANAIQQAWIESAIADLSAPAATPVTREVVIPVAYGGEHGPDLADVAAHTGLTPAEIIRRHAEGHYVIGALGFSPGFAFLIGLPPELTTPRRSTPRTVVPEGSVGIGGAQTGVYSLPTPGGWSLIGRTPLRLFRPELDDPLIFAAGDVVRFQPISTERYHELKSDQVEVSPETIPTNATFAVLTPGLQTSVQDLGRLGLGRFGVSPGGAADRGALIGANRLVGNGDNTAGLEITMLGPRLHVLRTCSIAITGADLGPVINGEPLPLGRRIVLSPGDELWFEPARSATTGARAYLAVAGGFDVPVMMGSRSTDLTANFGGWLGRALRKGDQLPVAPVDPTASSTHHSGNGRTRSHKDSDPQTLRIVRGPQAERFDESAWESFLGGVFTVSSQSNRLGLRLEGSLVKPIGRADVISEGIVTGAIQITSEGQPIVMLPARATIGGYAKIATVITADHDRLGQLRPGARVQFTEVSVDEAVRLAHGTEDLLEKSGLTLQESLAIVKGLAFSEMSLVEISLPARGLSLRIRRGDRPD